MGLTIRSKGSRISFSGGYGSILRIRKKVAMAFDKEFGEHYAKLGTFFGSEEFKKFDEKTNDILSDDRFKQEDEDIVIFLFMPDSEGKINYRTCKKILDLIKDDNEETAIIYTAYSDGKDWEHFKEFLQETYSTRSNMEWS